MLNRRHLRLPVLVLAFAGVTALSIALAGNRGLPASHGILNFGKVSDHLYRGAEPDTPAITNLAQLGVKTIIDLRMGKEVRATEAADAAACGITYTNIPLKGLGRPPAEKVAQILALIDASPSAVFVHCEHGCDRTGTIVACYRLQHDHWTLADAMKEADLYGMSKLERGMREFVADFAAAQSKK